MRTIVKSGFLKKTHDVIKADKVAEAADIFVMVAILAISEKFADIVDPGLKPNHPNHKINVPSVASGKSCPGIGLIFPFIY